MFGKNATVAGLSAVLLSSALAASASAKVYAVVNPGFEATDASGGDVQGAAGWTIYPGDGAYTTAATHRSGNQAAKTFGSPGLLQQTLAATDPVGTVYTASVFAASLSNDALTGNNGAFINLDFLDSAGNVIYTSYGSALTSASAQDTYTQLTAAGASTADTRSVRIDLVSGPYTAQPGNAGGAAFFDDVALTTPTSTPEPASLAALGVAGLGLLARRRTA